MIAIIDEPEREHYARLLAFMATKARTFSLVRRESPAFGKDAVQVGRALRRYMLKKVRAGKWPGSELVGSMATVMHYELNEKTMAVLAEAKSLYSWVAPDRPEDLCFYLPDGRCCLASVAHEGDSWFMSGVSMAEAKAALPGIEMEQE